MVCGDSTRCEGAGVGSFPHGPEEVTTEWLRASLGTDVRSFELEQIGIGVGLLGRLYRVTADGADGTATAVAKFPTLDTGAREGVVEPLDFYRKEVAFYRHAAATTPFGTPTVHAADYDDDTGDFVLLLEDLSHLRVADQTVGATPEDAARVIDIIARHHARFWNEAGLDARAWLPVNAAPPIPEVAAGMTAHALPKFLDSFGDRLDDELRAFAEQLPDNVLRFLRCGTSGPATFLHGDLRLDNLFFDDEPDAVSAIDWQIAGRGAGAYDVGYFVSQSLAPDVRRSCEASLRDRYLSALDDAGAGYPESDFDLDYARTIAHCSIYAIISAGQIELDSERAVDLVSGMLDRSLAAIRDNDALAAWSTM